MIDRNEAVMAIKKYLDDEDRLNGIEPNDRHNKWRAEVILESVAEQTEPQTEVIACPIQEENAEYFKWIYKDEPQTDGYISGEDFMKIFDEPQTERSE